MYAKAKADSLIFTSGFFLVYDIHGIDDWTPCQRIAFSFTAPPALNKAGHVLGDVHFLASLGAGAGTSRISFTPFFQVFTSMVLFLSEHNFNIFDLC